MASWPAAAETARFRFRRSRGLRSWWLYRCRPSSLNRHFGNAVARLNESPSATVKGILPHCGTAGQAWQAGEVKGRLPLWQRYRQSLHDYSPPTIRGVDLPAVGHLVSCIRHEGVFWTSNPFLMSRFAVGSSLAYK